MEFVLVLDAIVQIYSLEVSHHNSNLLKDVIILANNTFDALKFWMPKFHF